MNKKTFIISDIHGHYNITIKALESAGYNKDNGDRIIILGDVFDRGDESLAIYEWIRSNNNIICLKGNHEYILEDYLDGTTISPFNYLHNGTNETLADFWHRTAPFESWCLLEGQCEMNHESFAKWINIVKKDINTEYPDLLHWLQTLPNYYELDFPNGKKYIMTHGIIDTVAPDWKQPRKGWEDQTWAKPYEVAKFHNNLNATVIVGHINAGLIRAEWSLPGGQRDNSILYLNNRGQNLYVIDTCTILTQQVNVLVIDENGEVINETEKVKEGSI